MRAIAYYLPQFHPIPENDEWWGTGFTEWTNTAKAKPLFPGHYQPHVPGDLGFYDLRLPEIREQQAALARAYGVEAFCYYHYWFGNGRRLLERPFQEVLASGRPDFPFCLCWANESWTGVWHGVPNRVLLQQTYPGKADYQAHFESLLPAFLDKRYVKVEGKPLFLVYSPRELPDQKGFTGLWRELARRAGLPGFFFVGVDNEPWTPSANGFDGSTPKLLHLAQRSENGSLLFRLKRRYRRACRRPERVFLYRKAIKHFRLPECDKPNIYPCVIPNWDNTPRSGAKGLVLRDSTPELFRAHLRDALAQIQRKPSDHRLVFIKSWNEWAEGNHLEPDLKFGAGFLEVLKSESARCSHQTPSAPIAAPGLAHVEA